MSEECKQESETEAFSVRLFRILHNLSYLSFPDFFIHFYERNIQSFCYTLNDSFHSTEDMFNSLMEKAFPLLDVIMNDHYDHDQLHYLTILIYSFEECFGPHKPNRDVFPFKLTYH